ncbi:MAG: caspase family protein [Candidatus Competibacteraceae bacterium]|nr:caspase family protein [Candidatus Competibacteraceae bacterium]
MPRLHLFFTFLLGLLSLNSVADENGNKFALVIGNSNYVNSPLKNPINDASDVANHLKEMGYEVYIKQDLDHAAMEQEITLFSSKLKQGDVGIYFYAGHAVQYNGQNYLIPVNAIDKIRSVGDLNKETISLEFVLNNLNYNDGTLNAIILDACRTSPFTDLPEIKSGLSRGLKRITNDHKNDATQATAENLEGTLIAFSTSPNKVALDGIGRNSPYTKSLIKHISKPNTSIESILKATRNDVVTETKGKQTPWYESSINGDFYPAGKGMIDFLKLLGVLFGQTEGDAFHDWLTGSAKSTPIKWRHTGIISTSNDPIQHEYERDTLKSLGAYIREGEVVLTSKGKPSGYVLREKREPKPWYIQLIGPRLVGPTIIRLGESIVSRDEDLYIPQKNISNKTTLCQIEGLQIHIVESFMIKLENVQPFWGVFAKSCGGMEGLCGRSYTFFKEKPTAEQLQLETQDCFEDKKLLGLTG